MKTHHGGPIEYIGSRYKRSLPPNITRVRKKNAARDNALAHGKSSVRYGVQKVFIRRLSEAEWMDVDLHRKCKKLSDAKALAKLFLEKYVIRWRGGWYVRCV